MRLMPSCGGQLLHVLLLQLVAVGCGPGVREPSVQVVRMGPQVPPKSSDCSVPTLTIDVQQVGLAFETLGTLVLRAELDAEARRALERHACALGGDYLVPAMAVSGTSSFFVVKPRPGVRVRDGQVFLRGGEGRSMPTQADPANKPIVAVAPIDDRAHLLSAEEREQLASYLATQITRAGRHRVVPPEQARLRLAADKRESYRLCYDSRCQIELGKALAAQKTIAMRVLRLGGHCSLVANLYDLKTETAEAAASRAVPCGSAGIQAGIDGVVAELTGAAPHR